MKITFNDLLETVDKLDFPIIEKLDDNLYKLEGVICNKILLDTITKALGLMYKDKLDNT